MILYPPGTARPAPEHARQNVIIKISIKPNLSNPSGQTLMGEPEELQEPSQYEATHVHAIYQEIAPHFSSTRHKPWPLVSSFLTSLLPGSIGLDVGCGNGKYLPVNPNIFIIASDRSAKLVEIAARHERHGVIVADALDLPHQAGRFDFAMSIAMLHHLSTAERRVEGVRAVLDTLRAGQGLGEERARALFYVWALEQRGSRRGWGNGDEQDVLVPWVMKSDGSGQGSEEAQTFNRYYHLYKEGELEKDIAAAGGVMVESGYERDNWWAIANRGKS